MRVVAGAVVYFVIVVAAVFFGYQYFFAQPTADEENQRASPLNSTETFVLSNIQDPITVGAKDRQVWQTISRTFPGQPGQVVGVLYKQTKATTKTDSNLTVKRVDNSEFTDDLPGLWPDTVEQLNGEPVCAIATGNYDQFRRGEDICNDFFSEFMNQGLNQTPVALNLPVGQQISPGESFRLTWQRGWGDSTADSFAISDLQFVYYNP